MLNTTMFEETVSTSRDAFLSYAWLYPIRGIVYFATHPKLYREAAPALVKGLLVSVGITGGLFFFTYMPQVALCAPFTGPLAFVAAAAMVFAEAYVVIRIVAGELFGAGIRDALFDAVMVQQGNEALVSRARRTQGGTSSGTSVEKVVNAIRKPFGLLSKEGMLRYVLSLPLNVIPGVGTAMFLVYNGFNAGIGYHARYFQLKEFDRTKRVAFAEQHRGAYTGFGATSLALGLVPFIGLVFTFTSSVGAALWASEIEKGRDYVR